MTYDERRQIEEHIEIVKKNFERLRRSIDNLKGCLEELKCETEKYGKEKEDEQSRDT